MRAKEGQKGHRGPPSLSTVRQGQQKHPQNMERVVSIGKEEMESRKNETWPQLLIRPLFFFCGAVTKQMPHCNAITKSGTLCKHPLTGRKKRCAQHGKRKKQKPKPTVSTLAAGDELRAKVLTNICKASESQLKQILDRMQSPAAPSPSSQRPPKRPRPPPSPIVLSDEEDDSDEEQKEIKEFNVDFQDFDDEGKKEVRQNWRKYTSEKMRPSYYGKASSILERLSQLYGLNPDENFVAEFTEFEAGIVMHQGALHMIVGIHVRAPSQPTGKFKIVSVDLQPSDDEDY